MSVMTAGLAPPGTWQLFDPVLEKLHTESAARFGIPGARLLPVAYYERPFSHILRVGVCQTGSNTPDRHVFVKVFKPKPHDGGVDKMRRRVLHDFEVTRTISESLARGPSDLQAVKPIACYPDELAMVTEEVPGETAMAYLDARARWFPGEDATRDLVATFTKIGRWVRALQSIEPATGTLSMDALREYVDLRLRRLVEGHAIAQAYRDRILNHLSALAAAVPPDERVEVLVHADLALGNIIVGDDRIVALDLAMVQRGTVVHDVSRVYLQLDILRAKPYFRGAVIRRLQDAVLHGYDETLTAQRPLFRYLLMLHRVNHLTTLSLKPEPLPSRIMSVRVLRIHRRWIEDELARSAA